MKNRELISKFISTEGYKRNSKDKNNPINIIPSNNITMKDVEFPVEGTDNLGNTQVMYPGLDYIFPGDYVVEKKFQQGGPAWLNGLDTKNINYLNNDSYTKAQIAKKNREEAAKKASTQKAVSKIPAAKIPADRREAEIMIANGDIKVETIAEIKEREAREAEEAKLAREATLKAYETRVNTPGYSPIKGLPNESFTTMLANEAAPLADKFRVSNENNFFDDYINPAVWIGSMAKSLGEAPKQSQETGSILPYVAAIGMPLAAGALGSIGAKNTGEFVNNMINPLPNFKSANFKSEIDWGNWNLFKKENKFTPNSESYYRVIGDEVGYNDLINSGVVRPNQNGIFSGRNTYYTKGAINDINNPVVGGGVKKGTAYKGNYIVEVNKNDIHFPTQEHGLNKDWNFGITKPGNEIPYSSEHLNVYKRVGNNYVKLNKKETPFQSEINWGNWNKEILDNPQLMQEYNAIEQTSKANGTWMKYSDGSEFNGTPEQFIQMRHPNTHKWAGGAEEAEAIYKNRLYRGAHQHIVDFKNRDRKDFATFLTDNKRNAETYATADGLEKRYFDPNIDNPDDWIDGLYELGFPQNLPTIEGQGANNTFRFLDHNKKVDPSYLSASHNRNNFKTDLTYAKEYQYEYPKDFDISNNYLSTDDYAKYVKNKNNPEVIAKINNVRDQMGFAKDIPANTVYAVDAERVSLKSLRHNNGMFDMTNPNIYKGLIPAGVVGTAISKQEYKQGGEMNKFKKYPAGGPVTPESPPAASSSFSFDNTMQEMYAEDMYNKYGRFIITDKGLAKTYYGTKDDKGQWQVNIIENVLGEGSKDPNNQILDLSKHSSFEKYATSKPKDYVTPTGYYDLNNAKTYIDPDQGFSYTKNMNHPGDNALMMIGTGSALVDLYHNGEMYKERLKAYNNNTPEDNYLSHGCINCKKAGIEDLYNFYNSGEPIPSFIFDSRISPEENMKYAEINNPETFGRESRNQVMFKADPINPINENFDLRRFMREDNIQKVKPRLDALVDISKGGDEMTYTDYESIYNKRPVEEGIEKVAGKQTTLDIPFDKETKVPNKSEQLTSIQGKKGNISIPENREMKNKPMPQLNQKESIKEKQKMLKEEGLYTGEIDGIWGVKSEAAWRKYSGQSSGGAEEVKEFQRTMNKEHNANLKVDGIWGPKTQEAWRKYNKKQEGGVINPEYELMSKVLSQRNKDLNWVDRGLNPDNYPSITNEDGSVSTHKLSYVTGDDGEAYVYPTIVLQEDGSLKELTPDEAWKYAKDTNTAMRVPNVKLAEYYSKNGLIKHQNGGIHNSLVTANSLGNYNSQMWQLPNTGLLGNLKLASGLISGLSGSALGFMGLGKKKPSFADYDSDPKQYYQTEDKPINYNTIDNNPVMYAKDGGVMQLGGIASLSTALPMLGVNFTAPAMLGPMDTSAMNLTSILGNNLSTDKQTPQPAKMSNNPMFGSNSGIGSQMGQKMFSENLKTTIQGFPEPIINEKEDNNPLSKFLGTIKNKGMFSNKAKPSGQEIAFNSIAGLGMANDVLTQKEFEKMNYVDKIRTANNTMERYKTVNPDNPYGNYTLNAGIGPNFALNKVGAIQDFGTGMSMAKHGGEFKEGGEYYLSEEEIQKLIDEGADIEFVK